MLCRQAQRRATECSLSPGPTCRCSYRLGAGQARLIELVEVCPDFLKFDMSLIRDIDKAGPQRQQMISTLVRMALDLEVVPLAEGIETESEAETCEQLGFELGQGFFFGRPLPVRNDDSQPYIPSPQMNASV